MSKRPKVVVVDDDFYLLDALNIQLNCEDYDVITLENGLKAYETVKAEQPDCVVLDVMMPGKTGIEVARELKADETTRMIPVILLTAKSELDDKLAGFDSGIEDYITKPFDFRELNARIRSQIRLYASIKEAHENRYAQKAKLLSDHELKLISWDSSVHTILFSNTKILQDKKCLDIFGCHTRDCPMRVNEKQEDSQELSVNLTGYNPVKILKECRTNSISGNEITITDHRTTREIIDQLVSLNEKLLKDATQGQSLPQENVRFLTNLNHELKGPLSVIIGYADMINQNRTDEDKNRKYLEIIDKSARHIMSMLMEMIELSRPGSEQSGLHRELVSFSDLVETVLAILEFNIEQRQVKVNATFDNRIDLIKVDPNRFKQLLLNLFSNAVKYNKVGGTVTLTSKLSDKDFIVTISDTGIGIPSDNIPIITADFGKAGKPIAARGSMGYGVKLAKVIADMHGGSLVMESELGVGTTVTITIPKEQVLS